MVLHELNRRVIGAGPLLSSDKEADDPEATPLGSLIFFNAPTDEFARDFAKRDPYSVAGLFDNVFIARFVPVRGLPAASRRLPHQ